MVNNGLSRETNNSEFFHRFVKWSIKDYQVKQTIQIFFHRFRFVPPRSSPFDVSVTILFTITIY